MQRRLKAFWGTGFKMILTDGMKSEINDVKYSNDKHEVFHSGNTGRQCMDLQQGGEELAHVE